jgi:NADPH-dependent curcumin reductase CurA
MPTTNKQVLLARRPYGEPKEDDFSVVDTALDDPREGQILVRNRFLSLDPYMRGRMNDAKSYAAPVALGDVMVGGTVGEVVASKHPRFRQGDVVTGALGWQEHALVEGASAGLVKIKERPGVPLSAYLGAVGMPGVTAYHGLFDIGTPKPGETVVVGAAAGAVGSVVGQLAKLTGCRAIGIAGGAEKCAHVVKDLGFDACVDHRSATLKDDLAAATPAGIDVYFENVGGPLLDLVLGRINPFARIPLCGLVSQYSETQPYGVKNVVSLLTNRVRLQGFVVSDRMDRWPEAQQRLAGWVAEKKIVFRETVAEGLASAPRAFIGMLRGENLGKQLVRL